MCKAKYESVSLVESLDVLSTVAVPLTAGASNGLHHLSCILYGWAHKRNFWGLREQFAVQCYHLGCLPRACGVPAELIPSICSEKPPLIVCAWEACVSSLAALQCHPDPAFGDLHSHDDEELQDRLCSCRHVSFLPANTPTATIHVIIIAMRLKPRHALMASLLFRTGASRCRNGPSSHQKKSCWRASWTG